MKTNTVEIPWSDTCYQKPPYGSGKQAMARILMSRRAQAQPVTMGKSFLLEVLAHATRAS
jgi:hypothetical protein